MQFRGVAHVHSTYSFDGKSTLQDLANFLRLRNVNFVLLSEHVESLDPERLQKFIADCRRYSSDNFLLIPGVEIDALNALFYDVQAVPSWENNEDLARQFSASGAMVVVSHPVKIKANIPEITEATVEGVEIWNSRHDGKLAPNSRIIHFWRSLGTRLHRELLPLCGIDFHSEDDFIPLALDLSCERLRGQEIMTAIRAGQYTIALAGKALPLRKGTAVLPKRYLVFANFYRLIYVLAYATYRAGRRIGITVPSPLKSRLRRLF